MLYVVRSTYENRPIVKVFTESDRASLLDYVKKRDVHSPEGPLPDPGFVQAAIRGFDGFLADPDPEAFFAWVHYGGPEDFNLYGQSDDFNFYADYPNDEYEATLIMQKVPLVPVTTAIPQITFNEKVFDVFNYEEVPIQQFLDADPANNIVAIVNGTTAYGLNRQFMWDSWTTHEGWRYQCNREGGLFIRPEDVDFANPYMKLDIPYAILIRNSDALKIMYSAHRIWSFDSYLPKQRIEPIASHFVLTNNGVNNLDGQPLNVVASSHCQSGTGLELMTVSPISVTPVGLGGKKMYGGRTSKRSKTFKTRSKHSKRSKTLKRSAKRSKRSKKLSKY